jgi:cytochrome b pre-mRNA-processing protein 3
MLMIFGSRSRRRAAAELYGAAVAAARMPAFYSRYGVADTIEGRYEMIVLHVVLLLMALRSAGREGSKLAQALVDFMAADLDRSIRELGVGDLSVSRFMKRLGEGLYGRAAAYEAALTSDSAALSGVLLRNVYGGIDPGPGILAELADYTQLQHHHIAGQPITQSNAGHIDFLTPRGSES